MGVIAESWLEMLKKESESKDSDFDIHSKSEGRRAYNNLDQDILETEGERCNWGQEQ